jgi:UDP-glucose 4-epimerase
LVVYGDGEQTRDFLFVGDLCQAIAEAVSVAELPFGRAIQLGTGKETSINQLFAEMRQVVGKQPFLKIRYAPQRPGEVRRSFVSISRAQQFLNFSAQTELLAGL